MIYKKGKQSEYFIHKIMIVEYPICEKIVKENKDHYCPPARETDLTILINIPWWDTIHLGSQTSLDLIKE